MVIFLYIHLFISTFLLDLTKKNDAIWLNNAILKAVKTRQTLTLPKNRTFYIDKGINAIKFKDNDVLRINGNGSKIIFTANSGKHASILFDINARGTKNTYFELRNITIDGSPNPTQFEEKNYEKLRLAQGVMTLGVTNVSISSSTFKNLYGSGIVTHIFKSLSASRVYFNKVGGKWYKSDGFDSFGDAIYLGYSLAQGIATIKNCSIIGYSDQDALGGFYKNLSRAGVVAEYNKKSHLNLNITNTRFEGYQRSIHIEGSNTSLKMDKCVFDRFICGVFAYGFEAKDIQISNSTFLKIYEEGAFGASKGIVSGYAVNNQAFISNCVISNNVFYRENEMKCNYLNCEFTFSRSTKPSRSSIFTNCKIKTPQSLSNQFGKIINRR